MALLIDGKENLINSKKNDFKDQFVNNQISLGNISNDNINHKASCSCEIEISNGNFDKRYFTLICKQINFKYGLEGNIRLVEQPINSIYDNNSSFTWKDLNGKQKEATIQYTSIISETLGKIKITFETALPEDFSLTDAYLFVDFIVYDVNMEGDVSIGGSLTIPSDKSIIVNTIESGTIDVDRMNGGSININSMNGGSINILNKLNGSINTQNISNIKTDNIIEVYTKEKDSNYIDTNWYYIPEQTIDDIEDYSKFTLEETIMNIKNTQDIVIATEFHLIYKDNKIQLQYTDRFLRITYYDKITYYKLPIKVIE